MPDFIELSEPPLRLLERASLFLDLDGTLLELADSPHDVRVSDEAARVLELAGANLSGRVALISGRSADDVAALFPKLMLNIGGSHGLEQRWADGRRNTPARGDAIGHALGRLRAFEAMHDGLLVEDKPFGTALHFRRVPQLEAESRALAASIAEQTGLILQTGKMVVELKTSTQNKGDALATFMADAPMRDGVPVFLGDDDTDEPAFEMARKLGGAGILVGPVRETHANWRLPGVSAALDWLLTGLQASVSGAGS